MHAQGLISYLITWAVLGALLFSVFVVFVFRSDLVYTSRERDGTLKASIPLRGYVVMGAFLISIVAYFVGANVVGLRPYREDLTFLSIFALNLALYLILFIYDTVFIDGFVIGIWRPKFLQLPEEMGAESMREHILKSILPGIIFGILISGVSALISYSILR